jgi:hypothetical protein
MKLYDAIEIIEDIDDGVYSEDKYLEAWQLLVDTGVWLGHFKVLMGGQRTH